MNTMDDFALAVRCYELGAVWFDETEGIYWTIRADRNAGEYIGSTKFVVRDWRVAGALLEKCHTNGLSMLVANLPDDIALITIHGPMTTAEEYANGKNRGWLAQVSGKDLVRLIIEAAATALARDHDDQSQ